jgi:ATP-dependent helicase HrpA
VTRPELLRLSRDELMRHEASGITTDAFPRAMEMGGVTMPLDYHFEPASARDGVTLEVPIYALNQVDAARVEWLVPGMLKEKITWLVKSLPQRVRRHAVPVGNYVDDFIERESARQSPVGLLTALCTDFREAFALTVRETDFKTETLPLHLRMNFRVSDAHGRQLAVGRSLPALRAQLGDEAQRQFQEAFKKARTLGGAKSAPDEIATIPGLAEFVEPLQQTRDVDAPAAELISGPLTDWTFGSLPELLELERGGQTLVGYPALVDQQDFCRIEIFDDPQQARSAHRRGLMRLFALQLKEPLKFISKSLPELNTMAMQYMSLGSIDDLREQIIGTALERACLAEPLPDDAQSFHDRLKEGRSRLSLLVQEIARQTAQVLAEFHTVQKKLPLLRSFPPALADIEAQLRFLVTRDFVQQTPQANWPNFPRYLKAIVLRIDKLRADPARDSRLMLDLAPLESRWRRALEQRRGQPDPALMEFGWLLQELRVATYAQELRTPMPVSVKRLLRVWESMQR